MTTMTQSVDIAMNEINAKTPAVQANSASDGATASTKAGKGVGPMDPRSTWSNIVAGTSKANEHNDTDTLQLPQIDWAEGVNDEHGRMMAESLGPVLFQASHEANDVKYAHLRACIMREDVQNLPNAIIVDLPCGGHFTQEVKYTWLPDSCYKCRKRGHKARECPEAFHQANARGKGKTPLRNANAPHLGTTNGNLPESSNANLDTQAGYTPHRQKRQWKPKTPHRPLQEPASSQGTLTPKPKPGRSHTSLQNRFAKPVLQPFGRVPPFLDQTQLLTQPLTKPDTGGNSPVSHCSQEALMQPLNDSPQGNLKAARNQTGSKLNQDVRSEGTDAAKGTPKARWGEEVNLNAHPPLQEAPLIDLAGAEDALSTLVTQLLDAATPVRVENGAHFNLNTPQQLMITDQHQISPLEPAIVAKLRMTE
ncbi:hypothetical protein R1sor_008436 [Riccia sorocarpa]|uniref:CCHC-type domain-containing protein n=1 Tax=Riccia sorocarpa TaxID=122646 RepID=A0ABD3HTC6_9MARC